MACKLDRENPEIGFRVSSLGKVNGEAECDEEGHKCCDRRRKSICGWKDIIILDTKSLE